MGKVYSSVIVKPRSLKETRIMEDYAVTKGPLPPTHELSLSKSYWLSRIDFDGRLGDPTVVAQWQPGAKQWCHVGDYATGRDLNLTDYVVIGPAEQPEFPRVCKDDDGNIDVWVK